MAKLISTFSSADNAVSLTLHNNKFGGSNEYYAKVSRFTVSIDELIAEIAKKNAGIDTYAVRHSAELIKREMLELIERGHAVNVLDMGTLFLSVKGTITGTDPASMDIPDLVLRFTPSKEAQKAVSKVVVDKVMFSDGNPVIDTITDIVTKSKDDTVTAGSYVRLTGRNLKVGGPSAGIFFAPLTAEHTIVNDESKWIAVDNSHIDVNTTGTLTFFTPQALEPNTQYFIVVRTGITGGGVPRKSPVKGISYGAVTIM